MQRFANAGGNERMYDADCFAAESARIHAQARQKKSAEKRSKKIQKRRMLSVLVFFILGNGGRCGTKSAWK